jgi:hypothetical protein
MFGRKISRVQVGDSFTKTGGNRKIWTVTSICDAHARLVSKQPSPEQITISVGALADRALFEPFASEAANTNN